ncbi:hypothetical protein DS893_18850 [Vibrionales bacterium C3R12]|nr:hypothetical protein DS893_18850 [Vibrionales bacterium C3R12]
MMANKAFKSDSQRLAVSLRSSIAKRRSHLNAALGLHGGNHEKMHTIYSLTVFRWLSRNASNHSTSKTI